MELAMIVGDDKSMRRRVADALRAQQYQVEAVGLDADVVMEVRTSHPRVLVFYVKKPYAGDSLRLIRKVRKQSPRVPILVMAEAGVDTTLKKALELGHVDYVKAPFERFEFDHRLPLLVARSEEEAARSNAPAGVAAPIVRELHDTETGRLDAKRIADHLGVSLAQLAVALGKRYQTVHKSPTAESLQVPLSPIAHVIEMLERTLGDAGTVRAWLNRPNPDLGKRQPLAVILEGHVDALETLLENSLQGLPS